MAKNHTRKEPLHEHDDEAPPGDDERARKIMQLRRAIQTGAYDEEGSLKHLLGNMAGSASDESDTEPDAEQR